MKYWISGLLFLLIHSLTIGQSISSLSDLDSIRNLIDNSNISLQELQDIRMSDELSNDQNQINNYLQGYFFQSQYQKDKALEKYYKSLGNLQFDDLKQKIFFQMGSIYQSQGKIDSMNIYLDWIINRNKYDETHLGSLQLKISGYRIKRRFEESMNWLEVMETNKFNFPKNQQFRIPNAKGLIFLDRRKKGDDQTAFKLFDESIALFVLNSKNTLNENVELGKLYNNLGTVYYRRGSKYAKQATANYTLALNTLSGSEHVNSLIADIYNNLGIIEYFYQGNPENGISHLRKSINYLLKDVKDNMNLALGNRYNNLGEAFHEAKMYDSALHYLQKAIEVRVPGFNPRNQLDNPSKDQLKSSNQKSQLTLQFDNKLKAYHALNSKEDNPAYLDGILDTYYTIDNLADVRRMDVDLQETRINWQGAYSKFYRAAVKFCLEQNLTTDALYFSEKSRSLVLLSEINSRSALSNLPEGVQNIISAFQDSIRILSQSIPTKNSVGYSDALQNHHLYNSKFEAYLQSLEQTFPEYYAIKAGGLNRNNLNLILDRVEPDESIVEYFYDNSTLYQFIIQSDTIISFQKTIDDSFFDLIADYRESIYSYSSTTDKAHEYYSTILYSQLFEFPELLQEKLIIIPYGVLGLIAWDGLVVDSTLKTFLVHTHEISTTYSLNFLQANDSKISRTSKKVISFSPSYSVAKSVSPKLLASNRSSLQPLTHNKIVGTYLQDEYNASAYHDEYASIASFIEAAPEASIINLSMHAKMNSSQRDSSYLAFSNTTSNEYKFYVSDIANLNINADLVTLSACETGLGEFKSGEGIMSLGRAFTAAGSKANIISLWQVNDKSTSEIMAGFYKSLKKGQTIAQALRTAKLAYLDKASISEHHPFYWSGLQFMGTDTTLFQKSSYLKYLLLIGVLTIALIIGLVLSRVKSFKNS